MTQDQGYLAVNVRVPTGLKMKVEKYLAYINQPESELPRETAGWPNTLTGVVIASLEDFLVTHPQHDKRGAPRKRGATKPIPKQHTEGGDTDG